MTIRSHHLPGRLAVLALFAVGSLAACTGDDGGGSAAPDSTAAVTGDVTGDTTPLDDRTVLELARADASASTFVAAAQAAGFEPTLDGPGPLTVLVPTDAAFEVALTTLGVTREQLLADPATITSILSNHLVPGRLDRADLVALNGRTVSTVGGGQYAVSVVGSDVKVGDATVVGDGIASVNGVFLMIDAVLLPVESAPPATGEGTVLEVVESRDDLAAFSEMLVAAGFEDLVTGPGPLTVFAPTDDAFEDALTTLDIAYDDLLADTELLRTIVGNHLVEQRLSLGELAALANPDVETVAGATVRIALDGATLKVNDATVLSGNTEAGNGFVHLIDRVLLPAEF